MQNNSLLSEEQPKKKSLKLSGHLSGSLPNLGEGGFMGSDNKTGLIALFSRHTGLRKRCSKINKQITE